MLNKAWYWEITAFRGSVSTCTSVFSSRLCNGTTTGNRPTNSGIMPNSIRPLASTWRNNRSFSSMSWWVFDSPLRLARSAAAAALLPFPRLDGVPNPRYFSFFLLLMILSKPLKAPDATNRMFVVSTCTVSPWSFREFFSGTLTIVPSSSFNKP